MKLSTFSPPRKYRNQPISVNGERFDSLAEARRWAELQILLKAGEISELRRQVAFELVPSQRDRQGKAVRPVRYVADFVYRAKLEGGGPLIVEDTKGVRTPEFAIKAKLMLWRHGITVLETR
jgi:hypothetical protein